MLVVALEVCRHVFTRKIARYEIGDVVAGVGTKIETRAVKWIDKSRRITDAGPAGTANFFAVIWQCRKRVHVTFNRARVAKNFAPDRVRQNVRVQSLRDVRALRQLEDSAVVNNSGADIPAAERNDPAPPAVSHQMVGRP